MESNRSVHTRAPRRMTRALGPLPARLSSDFQPWHADLAYLESNHDFPHEIAACHVLESFRGFLELEHTVDQRANLMLADEGIHCHEVLARSDIDTPHRRVDPHDRICRQLAAVARQTADQ